jgi:DNA topoisomerase VI subunit B
VTVDEKPTFEPRILAIAAKLFEPRILALAHRLAEFERRAGGKFSSGPPRADFHPGKNLAQEPRNAPIVAAPGSSPGAGPHKLTRVAFRTSRLMEFCNMRELQNQTAHSFHEWPLVVAKELIDNSVDSAEEFEVAPSILVDVRRDADRDVMIVADNAGGIDASTIESVLDYTIRVSSREAYVSPTRGAQGNALKTILAMGYALDRKFGAAGDATGVTIIESRGVKHRVEFKVDHVLNEPKIVHDVSPSEVAAGTRITVQWPPTGLMRDAARGFKALVSAYVWFNPHLSLRGVWFGDEFVNVTATNPDWEKWRPSDPTSPHWYDEARIERYLAAYVLRDRDLGQTRTVRDFIAEFRGLARSGVQRKILTEDGCSHRSLADFFGIEKVNSAGIAKLLAAMKRHSKPVPPRLIGVIGAAHLKQRFLLAGGAEKTFKYAPRQGVTEDGVPYVVEVAFGLHQSGLERGEAAADRLIVTGANWSAAIRNPFRSFGSTGQGLDATLEKVRASAKQPVIFVMHLASARLQFADRGKSSIILDDDAEQPDD